MSDERKLSERFEVAANAATPGPWKRAEKRGHHPKGKRIDHGWEHHPCNDIVTNKGENIISSWGHDADGVSAADDDIDFIVLAANNRDRILEALRRDEDPRRAIADRECRDCHRPAQVWRGSCAECLTIRTEMVGRLMAGEDHAALTREMRRRFRDLAKGTAP